MILGTNFAFTGNFGEEGGPRFKIFGKGAQVRDFERGVPLPKPPPPRGRKKASGKPDFECQIIRQAVPGPDIVWEEELAVGFGTRKWCTKAPHPGFENVMTCLA